MTSDDGWPVVTFVCYVNHQPEDLRRFLRCMKEQYDQRFEIILADESPDQYSDKVAYEEEFDSLPALTYFRPWASDWGYSFANQLVRDKVDTELVVFCNDDDVYEPYFVAEMLEAFRVTGADLVFCDFTYKKLGGLVVAEPKLFKIDKSSFMIRKNVFEELRGFEDVGKWGDGIFIEKLVAARKYKVVKVNKVMFHKV